MLGQTPMTISKSDLGGKEKTKIFVTKFGYDDQLVPISTENKSYHVDLEYSPYSINSKDSDSALFDKSCLTKTGFVLNKLILSPGKTSPFLLSQHIRIYSNNDDIKLLMIGRLIDAKAIKDVKREFRNHKKSIEARLHQYFDPDLEEYIQAFKGTGCFKSIDVILDYKSKGIVQKFVPTEVYWSYYDKYNDWSGKDNLCKGSAGMEKFHRGVTDELKDKLNDLQFYVNPNLEFRWEKEFYLIRIVGAKCVLVELHFGEFLIQKLQQKKVFTLNDFPGNDKEELGLFLIYDIVRTENSDAQFKSLIEQYKV